MHSPYAIDYLANHPQHIDACAAWTYGRWGVQVDGKSLEYAQKRFQECAQKDSIPLTLIAINADNNLPVGMASLWSQDGNEWADLTPWAAAVFVHYRHRNKGLASELINRLEQEAMRLGFKDLFLKSGSAAPLYQKLNYTQVDHISADTNAGVLTLFRKTLT